ncbi:MAG: hypothetical protein ACFFDK_05225 [Promethearchaeota archaeon]
MATDKDYHKMINTPKSDRSKKTTVKINKQNFTELICDSCNSKDVIETREGYVCGCCGLVLEGKKIIFNRPYFSDIQHYAKMGTTHIGNVRERLAHAHSKKLTHLQKLHSIESNEKELLTHAKIEISRIFMGLNLPPSLKQLVYYKFIKIRSAIRPGTKYRTPEKLVPLTIYFVCKFDNISINEDELLEVSKISKKDFNAFKLQILNFFPEYIERDRKTYVLQKIMEIAEHFKLGMEFYFQSKKILFRLWGSIKNTKDEVIAGLVTSISVLCSFKDKDVSVSAICNKLGIKMSTIQSQVKRRIFDQFQITGFTTLIKSSELLKNVMEKMGLLPIKKDEFNNEQINDAAAKRKNPEIVEIKLGGARQTCNHLMNIGHYFFAVANNKRTPVMVSLKSYDMSNFYSDAVVRGSIPNKQSTLNKDGTLFEVELIK